MYTYRDINPVDIVGSVFDISLLIRGDWKLISEAVTTVNSDLAEIVGDTYFNVPQKDETYRIYRDRIMGYRGLRSVLHDWFGSLSLHYDSGKLYESMSVDLNIMPETLKIHIHGAGKYSSDSINLCRIILEYAKEKGLKPNINSRIEDKGTGVVYKLFSLG